jgi:Zn-dependent membrane protease YugP
MYWDNTYILVIIGLVISMIASANVRSTFNKYSKVISSRGLTAESAALAIMRSAGITDVRIERVSGSLTDHYDPSAKVLRLSESVYGSTSVAAIGVAAHESGHAIQHAQDYVPLKLRSLSVPVARIGSWLSWPVIVLGIAFGYADLTKIGIILFCTVIAFQLITLPVEFNASRRALAVLGSSYMLQGSELTGARKVLNAAALTYVASLFTSVLQLLRILLIFRGNRR